MRFKSNAIFDGKVYLNSVDEGSTTKVLVLGGSQEVQHRTLGNIVFSDTSDFLDSFTFNSPGIFQQNIATVNSANKTLTLSLVNQTAGTVFAAPSGLNGTPTFRGLVANDMPNLGYVSTNNVNGGNVALVSSIDLNSIDKTNILYVSATCTNKPGKSGGFTETNVYENLTTGLGYQLFFSPNAHDDFYFRLKNELWGSWFQVASREWIITDLITNKIRFNQQASNLIPNTIWVNTSGEPYFTNESGVSTKLLPDDQTIRVLTTNTTLDNTFHNCIVRVTASISITIPNSLRTDFNCVFDVYGTSVVGFLTGSGVTLNAPQGTLMGDNNTCNLYRISSNQFRLNGGLVVDESFLVQQEITSNVTLSDAYHGAYVMIKANCVITIPNGLLRNDFETYFDVQGNFTAEFVFEAGVTNSAPFGKFLRNNSTCMLKGLAENNFRLNGDLSIV